MNIYDKQMRHKLDLEINKIKRKVKDYPYKARMGL